MFFFIGSEFIGSILSEFDSNRRVFGSTAFIVTFEFLSTIRCSVLSKMCLSLQRCFILVKV